MTKLIHISVFLLCTCVAWSQQVVPDAAERFNPKFAVTLLAGQPNQIAGADIVHIDQPFNVLHGELNRFSMGSGLCFRMYRDESFFLHARFMYSTRRYSLYDSTMSDPVVQVQPGWTNSVTWTYVTDNAYRMNNLLFGIGGGHEGRYGNFTVRAGGEIDFISYSDVFVQNESRTYTLVNSDSSNGGNFTSRQTILFKDHITSPGLWAIGIMGHAALEYRLNAHFGIGATLYLGGFYCGAGNKIRTEEITNGNSYTDSNGISTQTRNDIVNENFYSVRQFDFSPLNGQLNFAFYFGEL